MKHSGTGSSSGKLSQVVEGSYVSIADRQSLLRRRTLPSYERTSSHILTTAFEKWFPYLSYLMNEKNEWQATFKLLQLAEKTFNRRDIARTDKWKELVALVVRNYRDWLAVLRSCPLLQEPNVRQLSRQMREFVMVAVEEPTHSVPLKVVSPKEMRIVKGKLPVRKSTKLLIPDYTRSGPHKSMSMHGDSGISPFFSATENTSSMGSIGPAKYLKTWGMSASTSRESIYNVHSTTSRLVVNSSKSHQERPLLSSHLAPPSRIETHGMHAHTSAFIEVVVNQILEKSQRRFLSVRGRKPSGYEFVSVLDHGHHFNHLGQILAKAPDGRRVGVRRMACAPLICKLNDDLVETQERWLMERVVTPPKKLILDIQQMRRTLLAEFEEDWRQQRRKPVSTLKFSSVQEKARTIIGTKQEIGFICPLGRNRKRQIAKRKLKLLNLASIGCSQYE